MALRMTENHTELSFRYMRIKGHKEKLLDFLLRKFRYLDREEWLENIREKRLTVDGRNADPFQLLKDHQKILYLRPDFLEPEVDSSFDKIFEDDFLVAFNKPGNLPTSPSGKYYKNTLVNLAKKKYGWKKLFTLHRLDRETSGVILFAKQKKTAQNMAEMFREQQTHKFYKAILENSLPADDVIVSMPIGSDLKSSIRIKQGVQFEGRPCTTHFHLLKNLDKRCLVGIRPMTGRTHQIRVHAHYIGCPVTGDKLYGLADDGFLNWLEEGQSYLDQLNFPVSRQLLHAMEITFTHPESKEALTIHADDSKMLQMIPN
ncbi:MAG: RluA family pseudouridine synthase [SAR324 cluster bacterium]|nr:RluA family pseudouridine synthase [SAR324 cluster bacterium]